MKLTAIMPVWNEAAGIDAALTSLLAIQGIDERIVVDGGSRDDTVARVRNHDGVRVVQGRRGRGPQQNAGAACAAGDVFLFVHADVTLPQTAAVAIRRALSSSGVVGGAFRVRHVATAGTTWMRLAVRIADLRSRYARIPYGDQVIFVRAEAFWAVGGFVEEPLMEDIALGRMLRARGRTVTVPDVVRVSARRFEKTPLRTCLAWNTFPALYALGVSPRTLARVYGHVR